MDCTQTTRKLSRFAGGEVPAEERQIILQHLSGCPSCTSSAAEAKRLRDSLRTMPTRSPSPQLTMRLRVLASREQSRRLGRLTLAKRLKTWGEHAAVGLNNLMRPLMLPVAGGCASACLMFGLLVPEFAQEFHPIRGDVPTALFTDGSLRDTIPAGISDTDVLLDVHIDETGHMTDYHVIAGQTLLQNPSARRRLESTLLVTQFTPANFFGTPTASKIRVSFRTNRIDVKG